MLRYVILYVINNNKWGEFLRYREVVEGTFLSRPNRFIAHVLIDGKKEIAHVKNTGRCRELLRESCKVYLSVSNNPRRKTKYDLIAALKERENLPPLLINLDSQIPNDVAEEWLKEGKLFSEYAYIKREVKYNNSRFDFYIEDGDKKIFLEVKGVTQEQNGIVMFPDAPTERGVKHLEELISAMEKGFEAYVLFVVQMKDISYLIPNDETHRAFGDTLRKAAEKGVKILAVDCEVTPDSIRAKGEVKVKLHN